MAEFNQKRLDYLEMRLASLPYGYVQTALDVGREGGPDPVSGALLIAIAVRESGLRNVLGDKGAARGSHQFLDKYHAVFLRQAPGCLAALTIAEHKPENWQVVRGQNALRPGYCPRWEDSCRYAGQILNSLYEQTKDDGWVPVEDCLQVAVAAYNLGYTRALKGYLEPRRKWTRAMRSALHPGEPTGLPADKYTTRGNYAADVLLRRSEINHLLRSSS